MKTFYKYLVLFSIGLLIGSLMSCEKPSSECSIFDLGKEGESYIALETNGNPSTIYVDGDRIKQEVCFL